MSHPREPIPQTCPQIDKIVGKIKYLSKQLPRDWGKLDDLEKLQELANEMQDLLEDCNSEFELLRRSNESLRNWGEKEAIDCDKLEEQTTCTVNERKFLDEIRENWRWNKQVNWIVLADWGDIDLDPEIISTLHQECFEANLQELVNG